MSNSESLDKMIEDPFEGKLETSMRQDEAVNNAESSSAKDDAASEINDTKTVVEPEAPQSENNTENKSIDFPLKETNSELQQTQNLEEKEADNKNSSNISDEITESKVPVSTNNQGSSSLSDSLPESKLQNSIEAVNNVSASSENIAKATNDTKTPSNQDSVFHPKVDDLNIQDSKNVDTKDTKNPISEPKVVEGVSAEESISTAKELSPENTNDTSIEKSKRSQPDTISNDITETPNKKVKSVRINSTQKEILIKIVTSLRSNKDADPFLEPVDPVLLNIPDYPDIIKKPMDLSTVLNKLNQGSYSLFDEVDSDIKQIFENCFLYNGKDSPISTMAKHLQKAYSNLLKKYNSQLTSQEESNLSSAPVVDTKAQLKHCSAILKELFKKQHYDIAFYFYEPVDYVALDIPSYPKIIKTPMDFGTINTKLINSQYTSSEDFYNDVKLVFQNCYKFNPKKHPVHVAGRAVEAIFDNKWEEYFGRNDNFSSGTKRNSINDSNDIGDISDTNSISNKNRRTSKTPKQSKKLDQSGTAKSGSKQKSGGSNSLDDIMDSDLSIEEKLKLSNVIETLPPERLQIAFDIIQSGYPEVIEQKEEIELDIDVLDFKTLRRLFEYVVFERVI
ncbi:SWR1 complex bromodomain subunit bdf1 [Smittium culicis]|uniref:SWR1 complex bromodomain subunit bdf1 n=1 Tax=Smittium culicis TaxID=133412 RepID=A0A1R1YEW2_9FUNG|nr:SWR1 complex bromodomain subunit bdf1 [Smittium culicis]